MAGPDVNIDTVIFQYKDGKEELVFTQENEMWFLQQASQKVRVEGFKIDQIIREVQQAKRYEEERPVDDLKGFELQPPNIAVTFKGKVKNQERTWKFNVGKEGAGKFTVYVNSSDRPNRGFPVVRSTIESLFF
jgi:hypothetical protein